MLLLLFQRTHFHLLLVLLLDGKNLSQDHVPFWPMSIGRASGLKGLGPTFGCKARSCFQRRSSAGSRMVPQRKSLWNTNESKHLLLEKALAPSIHTVSSFTGTLCFWSPLIIYPGCLRSSLLISKPVSSWERCPQGPGEESLQLKRCYYNSLSSYWHLVAFWCNYSLYRQKLAS